MALTGLLAAAAAALLTITSTLLPGAAPAPAADPNCSWRLASTQLYADLIGRTDDRSVQLRALLAASGVGSASFLPSSCTPGTGNGGTGGAGPPAPAPGTGGGAGGQGGSGSGSGGSGGPGAPAGNYVFDDEFDGTAVDTARWSVGDRPGDASNNESQCYIPGNVSVADGTLQIRSKVDSSCNGFRYTSGMVQWKDFTMLRGTIEIRAKQSGGQGSWPAQWLLGAKCQTAFKGTAENAGGCDWPNPGSDEIDIAEFKSDGPTVDWQNVVSGDSGFKTCKPTISDASQNWHVYTFTWTESALTWGIDGKTTCTQQEVVPKDPMFLIINNAMGGAGGAINDGDFPQTMQIDYVRVSDSTGTGTGTGAGAGSAAGGAAAGDNTGAQQGTGTAQGGGQTGDNAGDNQPGTDNNGDGSDTGDGSGGGDAGQGDNGAGN